jgi:hypothetical protein
MPNQCHIFQKQFRKHGSANFAENKTHKVLSRSPHRLTAVIIIIFNLRTAAFKAYCAMWIRRSNFRHQASPRVSPRESTQRRKVELQARNVREFCLNADFHVTFRDLFYMHLHFGIFHQLRHGTDGFTSPPKEGMLRIFSP